LIETGVVVGLYFDSRDKYLAHESLAELKELVSACGAQVSQQFIQHLKHPDSTYYVGRGKLAEIKSYLAEHPASFVVFDEDLSPSQQRNIEGELKIKVLDRTKIILDIFAQRAQTSEAKLQVELAQLEYLLPRLTGMWANLGRLGGGVGTRGPGETQLEMDRRRIRQKISFLKEKLKKVVQQRTVQRTRRKKQINIGIVGYTNAGKSTLLRTLSGKEVFVKDQLFATLDPLSREVWLPDLQKTVVFSDTVGFIRKLPHHLVEAFKATLEEVLEADFLLHVVDGSSQQMEEQIDAVFRILEELGAIKKPIFTIFNKSDLVVDSALLEDVMKDHPPALAISALKKPDVQIFLKEISEFVSPK
jgi:GTP-binding protein HflX